MGNGDRHRKAHPYRPEGVRHVPRFAPRRRVARGGEGRARAGAAGVRVNVRTSGDRATR